MNSEENALARRLEGVSDVFIPYVSAKDHGPRRGVDLMPAMLSG